MDFTGIGCGAKRQFNFATNGKIDKTLNHIDSTKAFIDVACKAIFTQVDNSTDPNRYNQMPAKAGFRKFGQETVTAIVKDFTQLNEGAISGNPVVIPTDATTITSLEKKKVLIAVNLIK